MNIKNFLFLMLFSFLFSFRSYAASICGENGFIYSDDSFCQKVCSSCSVVNLKSNSTAPSCNSNQVYVFSKDENKTFTISSNQAFWTGFNNLAIIENQNQNEMIRTLLVGSNISSAWIGLYDPNYSNSYGSIDKNRFVWYNGKKLLGYENFDQGEPNNQVIDGDGTQPILGEHWVHINTNGKWNDYGYHSAYGGQPQMRGVLEYQGVLKCVDTVLVDDSISAVVSTVQSDFCQNQKPCYACISDSINERDEISDFNNFRKCQLINNQYFCPLDAVQCNQQQQITYQYTYPIIRVSGTMSKSECYTFEGRGSGFVPTYLARYCLGHYQRDTFNFTLNGNNISIYGKIESRCSLHLEAHSTNNITFYYGSSIGSISFSRSGSDINISGSVVYSRGFCQGATFTGNGNKLCNENGQCLTFELECPDGYQPNISYQVPPDERYCVKKVITNVNVCPLDPNKTCFPYNSSYYCQKYDCIDVSNPSNLISDDTEQGANDENNNGWDQSTGNCLGSISIFSGQDKRCRKAGLQTGFQDCCKKTKTWFGLGKCNSDEQVLSKMRTTYLNKDWNTRDANCKEIGDYCSKKILGTCVQKKKTFCCFSSPLARIIHEQGRPQFNISWGTPKSPNCRGFSMEEFQMLDFSSIDLSEWINNFIEPEVKKQINDNLGTQMQQTIKNMPTPKLPQP